MYAQKLTFPKSISKLQITHEWVTIGGYNNHIIIHVVNIRTSLLKIGVLYLGILHKVTDPGTV